MPITELKMYVQALQEVMALAGVLQHLALADYVYVQMTLHLRQMINVRLTFQLV